MVQWLTLALAAALIALPLNAASAGLLDMLFGGMRRPAPQRSLPPAPPPEMQAYAPPAPLAFPAPSSPAPARRGRWTGYCVRLCDGRYFPIVRHAGASPAEVCRSFCPASRTMTFFGGGIDHAAASNGTRYTDLANAFLYRKELVTGCTCNGRDAFGLAPIDTASDPTLHKGDIVATRDGFVAYRGRERTSGEMNFTPIESYRGLSSTLRQKLSETQVTPAPAATALPIEAAPAATAADRQAQLVR